MQAIGESYTSMESCLFCSVQNEVKLLLELLPKYHAHVERYPHTLLIKFYGLHRVVPLNGSKVSQLESTNAFACAVRLPLWIAARSIHYASSKNMNHLKMSMSIHDNVLP